MFPTNMKTYLLKEQIKVEVIPGLHQYSIDGLRGDLCVDIIN